MHRSRMHILLRIFWTPLRIPCFWLTKDVFCDLQVLKPGSDAYSEAYQLVYAKTAALIFLSCLSFLFSEPFRRYHDQ